MEWRVTLGFQAFRDSQVFNEHFKWKLPDAVAAPQGGKKPDLGHSAEDFIKHVLSPCDHVNLIFQVWRVPLDLQDLLASRAVKDCQAHQVGVLGSTTVTLIPVGRICYAAVELCGSQPAMEVVKRASVLLLYFALYIQSTWINFCKSCPLRCHQEHFFLPFIYTYTYSL